ncbi:hypothetical protein QA645_38485 [Bradyrhizobium sp. CIAT3101]|uniref:hypothetical protein n=1 Tax=Bradyrhizobium sp. CIAT3101 TaxID=439387 RepID=UPI0024B1B4E1|nr:hypothetical protein [Bradyrhizobium sp. CIAT3101]WFU80325.1 hypothetical protein QA645_38485 [Bradyrhizobium sp. CIAT3101]
MTILFSLEIYGSGHDPQFELPWRFLVARIAAQTEYPKVQAASPTISDSKDRIEFSNRASNSHSDLWLERFLCRCHAAGGLRSAHWRRWDNAAGGTFGGQIAYRGELDVRSGGARQLGRFQRRNANLAFVGVEDETKFDAFVHGPGLRVEQRVAEC